MEIKNIKTIVALQILLVIYSFGGVVGKFAGKEYLFSLDFIFCYIGLLTILVIYAIGWQQIIKKISLITAYSNRAILVVWGIVWGKVFFDEAVTFAKILGSVIIIMGIYLVVSAKMEEDI